MIRGATGPAMPRWTESKRMFRDDASTPSTGTKSCWRTFAGLSYSTSAGCCLQKGALSFGSARVRASQ